MYQCAEMVAVCVCAVHAHMLDKKLTFNGKRFAWRDNKRRRLLLACLQYHIIFQVFVGLVPSPIIIIQSIFYYCCYSLVHFLCVVYENRVIFIAPYRYAFNSHSKKTTHIIDCVCMRQTLKIINILYIYSKQIDIRCLRYLLAHTKRILYFQLQENENK